MRLIAADGHVSTDLIRAGHRIRTDLGYSGRSVTGIRGPRSRPRELVSPEVVEPMP